LVKKEFLSGNEAVARGAYEAGVLVASAYPGTPSTEILEAISRYPEIYAEWAPNEKVSLEVAFGASLGGARTLVAMKHVGLNVAADPLFTISYTGVKGGLVVITADDPDMHSSQNEQDNRHYARAAKIPMIEPSDSQEAKDFIKEAYRISESFETPLLFRMTTRICHSSSIVELGERKEHPPSGYVKDIKKNVVIPSNARLRHQIVEERTKRLTQYALTSPLNKIEWKSKELGIITSGISYQYVKEVLPDASILKLGFSWPLSPQLIMQFASGVKELWVVEELDPFLETEIKAMGYKVKGKEAIPILGELNPNKVATAFKINNYPGINEPEKGLPLRPPVLCPGCPHRGIFYNLHKLELTVFGDIGCYTLGMMPPLEAIDTCICMGAGVGNAHGIEKALGTSFSRKAVAVIGDSTFIHSGITGLINIVYNKSTATVVILDNFSTAMTGHQPNPATGKTIRGEDTFRLDFVKLAEAVGVKDVKVVNPFNLKKSYEALKEAVENPEASVVISRAPCALLSKKKAPPFYVDADICNSCFSCLDIGCPAIAKKEGKAWIDQLLCVGCSLCAGLCQVGAILREVKKSE